MKLMQFIQGMFLTTCILLFAACKNDDGPIYLVSVDNQQKITDGTIELSLFSTGEKFFIRGGDGNYTLKNGDATIADYRYDGETLTFLPVSIGQTSTTIPTGKETATPYLSWSAILQMNTGWKAWKQKWKAITSPKETNRP